MKHTFFILLTVLLFLALLPAAFADGLSTPDASLPADSLNILVAKTDLSFRTYTMDTAEEKTLQLTAQDHTGAKIPVFWRSSDPSLATVDAQGLFTPSRDAEGTVTISCASTENPVQRCHIKVKLLRRVHNISLDHYQDYSIRGGSLLTLSPRFFNSGGTEYIPSDSRLVWEIVDGHEFAAFTNPDSGTLCTKEVWQEEEILIRVYSAANRKAETQLPLKIIPSVREVAILKSGQDVTGESIEFPLSAPLNLTVRCLPAQGKNTIKWSSSSAGVTVEDGLVKADAPGVAIITASATDGSGTSASVTVEFR